MDKTLFSLKNICSTTISNRPSAMNTATDLSRWGHPNGQMNTYLRPCWQSAWAVCWTWTWATMRGCTSSRAPSLPLLPQESTCCRLRFSLLLCLTDCVWPALRLQKHQCCLSRRLVGHSGHSACSRPQVYLDILKYWVISTSRRTEIVKYKYLIFNWLIISPVHHMKWLTWGKQTQHRNSEN